MRVLQILSYSWYSMGQVHACLQRAPKAHLDETDACEDSYLALSLQYYKEHRSVAASFFLDAVEWYSYLYVIPFIEKAVFGGNAQWAWLTWGVAPIASPIGNLLFGAVADRWGRKTSLLWASSVLTVGTLAQGLTPTGSHAGCIWMVTFRGLQGLGYGGKFSVSQVYLAEAAPLRILAASRVVAMVPVAAGLLAVAGAWRVFTLFLTPEQIYAWGWRLPFLFSGLLGPLPILLFLCEGHNTLHKPEETPDTASQGGAPDRTGQKPHATSGALSPYWRQLALGIAGVTVHYTFEGMGFLYLKYWLPRWAGWSGSEATAFVLTSTALYIGITPVMLYVADHIGLGKTSLAAGMLCTVYSGPMFMPQVWAHSHVWPAWGSCAIIYSLVLSGRSVVVVWAVDLFPSDIRGRAYGLTSTLGLCLGAITPGLCANSATAAAYYCVAASALGTLAIAVALVSHRKYKEEGPEGRWPQVAFIRDEPY